MFRRKQSSNCDRLIKIREEISQLTIRDISRCKKLVKKYSEILQRVVTKQEYIRLAPMTLECIAFNLAFDNTLKTLNMATDEAGKRIAQQYFDNAISRFRNDVDKLIKELN